MKGRYSAIWLVLGCLICFPTEGNAYSKREPVMTVFTLRHYCTELLKATYTVDYNQQYVDNVTGFVNGFYDAAHFFLPPKLPDFCAPVDISVRDTCTVFNAWLVRHIDDDDVMYAAPAMVRALKEAYPCE